MSGIVPSFILKKNRAVTHLDDVKGMISAFVDSDPYTVSMGAENDQGRCLRSLSFTQQPSDQIAIVIGDFLHNIRSACDHLVAGMSRPEFWAQVQLPIFDVDPFEIDPPTGQLFQERKGQRATWERFTQGVTDEGVAAITRLQPHAMTADDDTEVNGLTVLRDLSNTDKHRHLPVLASGLRNPTVIIQPPGGIQARQTYPGHLKDGARIGEPLPPDVRVAIQGTPLVVARVSSDEWDVELPSALDTILRAFTRVVFPALTPHLRVVGQ